MRQRMHLESLTMKNVTIIRRETSNTSKKQIQLASVNSSPTLTPDNRKSISDLHNNINIPDIFGSGKNGKIAANIIRNQNPKSTDYQTNEGSVSISGENDHQDNTLKEGQQDTYIDNDTQLQTPQ